MSHDHPPDWRWRPLAQISPQLALAVVAAEDQRFPSHWGFDVDAIQTALQDRQRGTSRRGASTISQQVAKNLFLWSEASWLRKGLEAGLTSGIELAWGKRRILEMYLNVAEFGDGVYGAEAAAQRFFGGSAALLRGVGASVDTPSSGPIGRAIAEPKAALCRQSQPRATGAGGLDRAADAVTWGYVLSGAVLPAAVRRFGCRRPGC